MLNGSIVGGFVLEKSSQSIRLSDAFRVKKEIVPGLAESIMTKAGTLGTIEIPYTSISHWHDLPSSLEIKVETKKVPTETKA